MTHLTFLALWFNLFPLGIIVFVNFESTPTATNNLKKKALQYAAQFANNFDSKRHGVILRVEREFLYKFSNIILIARK